MHYKTRANVYMVLGRGVVGSCFGVHYRSYLGGGRFHTLVNLLVALLFGFCMSSCENSVILNTILKNGFWFV
jgi:hypothetical protein